MPLRKNKTSQSAKSAELLKSTIQASLESLTILHKKYDKNVQEASCKRSAICDTQTTKTGYLLSLMQF
jgi:hypothetical protein